MPFRIDEVPHTRIVRVVEEDSAMQCESIYDGNRHRVFSLAFYMTYSEPEAEEVLAQTFLEAFRAFNKPSAEQIDVALVGELRHTRPIGTLTLNTKCEARTAQIRNNTKRPDLEEAVLQLPSTERMIFLMHDVESYDHARIARTIGITEAESAAGLFQARLRIRQLLSSKQQSA